MNLSIFVNRTRFNLSRESSFELGFPIHPQAFICPVCLAPWAKLFCEGINTPFQINDVSCFECGLKTFSHPIPGSLLDNCILSGMLDIGLLEALPAELVEREFELTLKASSC